ncbi:MAG TPA: matrixin family metalloprotease [Bryobacteraceae bacterium]|nr:matrixin family metalloprotease [Bryobacteraceae bacterium]
MKKLLLGVSLIASALAADVPQDVPYWVEPCTRHETGCVEGDVDLARWALEAWQQASGGRLRMVQADPDHALLHVVWAMPSGGLYGETVPIKVHGLPGAQVNVRIQDEGTSDKLMHATVVYLTCLHESGHALGLSHTRSFADIMYSFEYGGDIPEYFARYRRKLQLREDIRKNPGLSAADRANFLKIIGR